MVPASPARLRPAGRVSSLSLVLGANEWRFVDGLDWKPPREFAHLAWFILDGGSLEMVPSMIYDREKPLLFNKQADVIDYWRDRLRGVSPVTWHFNHQPFYTQPVDYHATKRPVLICVGGFS